MHVENENTTASQREHPPARKRGISYGGAQLMRISRVLPKSNLLHRKAMTLWGMDLWGRTTAGWMRLKGCLVAPWGILKRVIK